MRARSLAAVLCAAALITREGHAQELAESKPDGTKTEETRSPRNVENIVITATRTERPVTEVPVSVSVLPEQYVQDAPVNSVDDLLRTVPGIQLPIGSTLVQHPTSEAISMRGLGGTRTLVLLDGIPLNDPFFGYVQWNRVPKENIERIEVARGGGSSLFGSYALGGVINIVTRIPDRDEASVEAEYGSHDTYRINGRVARLFDDKKLRVGLNINYFDTGGYITTVPEQRGRIDIDSSTHSLNLQSRADYQFTDTFSGYLRTSWYDNFQQLGTRLSKNDQQTWDIAVGVKDTLPTSTQLGFNAFYLRDRFATFNTDLLDPESRDAEFLSNIHHTPTDDVGASLQAFHDLGGRFAASLTGGVDFRYIAGQDGDRNFDPSGMQILREVGSGNQRDVGVFASATAFPISDLEITPSARVDFYKNADGKDFREPGETERFPDKSTTQFDPKLAVRYQLLPSLAWRGAVYRAFRAPNLDELYRTFSSQGFAILLNPELDPEILVGGEVGFDFTHGPVKAQLNFFQNNVRDLVGSKVLSFGPVFTLGRINIGRMRSRGVEALFDVALGERFTLRPSYTFTDAVITENSEDPTQVGQRIPDVPKHAVFVDLAYHHPGGGTFTVRERFVGKRLDDGTQSRLLDSHNVVDLSASYPVYDHVEAFVFAENVLDEDYIASTFSVDQRGAPRGVYGGMRVSF